jgi:hypothetical protein
MFISVSSSFNVPKTYINVKFILKFDFIDFLSIKTLTTCIVRVQKVSNWTQNSFLSPYDSRPSI